MKNIVFFGTPEFGKIVLERLMETNYKPVLVVTQPDQPAGRKQILTPPPVKILAAQNKIPILQPEKLDQNTKYNIQHTKPDLIVVVAYGKIIPKDVLDIPAYGALNVHPSLLPRWKGPSPIQYTILHGDKETGVSVMLMDEKVDHGPILSTKKLKIKNEKFTAKELATRLAEIGADLLIETIPKWTAGEIQPKEQDHSQATHSKILTKEDGHIDWTKPAEEIERQIRAFTPWPGSFTYWENMRIKITSGYVAADPSSEELSYGQTSLFENNKISVQASKGTFIIERLQPEGKNEITTKQFLNGYPKIINSILE